MSERGAHDPVLAVAFDPRHRALFATARWAVFVHRNQWNLGRCLVVLRTREMDDPLTLTGDERDELWTETLPRLADAIRAAFEPDRLNYAHQANRRQQVHWHVIPRYESRPRREFAGHTFVDLRTGRTPRSKKSGNVPPQVLDAIVDRLRRELGES